ncbi:MAG: efflux RND transporter periplasmic adaptor subunit [Pirellulales bacterium]
MRNIGSKLFVFLIAAIVVVGLGYAFWPQPVEVDLAEVARGPLQVTVDEDGKTRIREKYVVSAPLAGRLLRIDMDAGDPVKAGKTLLATIEPRDPELLDARTIAQAEARMKAAEATLKKMEPMTEQVRAAQAFAEAELTRARTAGTAVSKSELENAEYEYRRASEEQRSVRIQEEIARFELEQAQAALLRTRPRDDEEGDGQSTGNGAWTFTIYSPINGQVLRVLQESAAVVNAGTPLLELGNPRDLEAEIDVLSRDAVKVHPGAKVWFEHWGGDRDLQGRVRLVEPSGFTKISTLGVEEQRVNVIVDFVDPPEERTTLGDGFRVEARIVIDEADDVLKVPTSALFRVGKESAVFKVAGGAVHEQIVKIGRQNGLEAEVLDGLAVGDKVVIHPSDQVEDGVHVRQR